MTRFHFDFIDGDDFSSDEDGLELESLQAAREEAARALAAIAREMLTGDARSLAFRIRTGEQQVAELTLTLDVSENRESTRH